MSWLPPPPPFVASIFNDKLVVDDRQPAVVFSVGVIPGLVDGAGQIKLGLLLPSPIFWVQLVVLLAFQTTLCIGLAFIILNFVVKRRGSPSAYLVGYGLVIPAVLAFPYAVISWLDIQNTMSRFVLYVPTLITFRVLEAMHCHEEDVPTAEASVLNYVLFYSCLVEVKYDAETTKPLSLTQMEIVKRLWRIISQYLDCCTCSDLSFTYFWCRCARIKSLDNCNQYDRFIPQSYSQQKLVV